MIILRKFNEKISTYKDDYTRGYNYLIPFIPNKLFRLSENLFCKYYFLKTLFTTFKLRGKKYKYFHHVYNHTWNNERRVEIPIIWDIVKDKKTANILEVGNVLSHYFSINHDVLDKYEKGKSVINEDIVTYKPKKKYDYIVSVSTLEHVGWDEPSKDKMKIVRAVDNLRTMLSKNGKIIFTVPLGYNPYMDAIIFKEKLNLSEKYFLKRISKDNLWMESKLNKTSRFVYNKPFSNGNAIIVGIINNS